MYVCMYVCMLLVSGEPVARDLGVKLIALEAITEFCLCAGCIPYHTYHTYSTYHIVHTIHTYIPYSTYHTYKHKFVQMFLHETLIQILANMYVVYIKMPPHTRNVCMYV